MRENLELKGKIAELQQKLSTPVARKEQHHGISPSKKEQEMSTLLEQINRQLETAERAKRQLTVDVERLTAQKSRLEREMLVQKSEIDEQKEQLQKSQREKEELEQKITVLLEQVCMYLCGSMPPWHGASSYCVWKTGKYQVMWVHVTKHGSSSGCVWRTQPPDMMYRCKYIE